MYRPSLPPTCAPCLEALRARPCVSACAGNVCGVGEEGRQKVEGGGDARLREIQAAAAADVPCRQRGARNGRGRTEPRPPPPTRRPEFREPPMAPERRSAVSGASPCRACGRARGCGEEVSERLVGSFRGGAFVDESLQCSLTECPYKPTASFAPAARSITGDRRASRAVSATRPRAATRCDSCLA